MSRSRSDLVFTTSAVLVAAIGLAVAYAGLIDTGLHYDDYHFVRPWSAGELRGVWSGSWDPTGIEPLFYRPLTAWLFAARFDLLALNDTAIHASSLAGHGICAVLVGWFLRRERMERAPALLGVWLYAIHPVFPLAQVSWATNQMHLAQSLVVLVALIVWQSVRDRMAIRWGPLGVLAATAFFIKEDGLMLLPALAVLTALRVRLAGARPPRGSVWLLVGAALLGIGLMAFRQEQLGGLGGYGLPALGRALLDYLKGPMATLVLWPTTSFVHGWQRAATVVAISALAAGLGVALARRDRASLSIIAMGLAVVLCFNLPFVLVTKPQQYHLLAFGAVLMLTGAGRVFWGSGDRPAARTALRVAILAATIPLALLARDMGGDFLPCTRRVLAGDRTAAAWPIVPDEIRAWMEVKAQHCSAGLRPPVLSDLPVVPWGLSRTERVDSLPPSRWMADRVVLLVRRDATSIALAMRRPGATSVQPVLATIRAAGSTSSVRVDSDDWIHTTVGLRTGALAWLRQGHRVEIGIQRGSPRGVELQIMGVRTDGR